MTVKSLVGYDIEELEDCYDLVITQLNKKYLVEFNGREIETVNMLDNYIDWHDAADLFHSFDDETNDWNSMTKNEQEYHMKLEKRMQEAEDKFF